MDNVRLTKLHRHFQEAQTTRNMKQHIKQQNISNNKVYQTTRYTKQQDVQRGKIYKMTKYTKQQDIPNDKI